MGFWAAMDEVYPQTRHQRCWVHKTANILNSLPKSSQPKAKEAIHEIWQAETKINAEKAFELFIETYQDKYPKTTLSYRKIVKSYWPFMISLLNIGRVSTRLNPPLVP